MSSKSIFCIKTSLIYSTITFKSCFIHTFEPFGLNTFDSTKSLRLSGNTFDIKMFKIIKSHDKCEIRSVINILSLTFIARLLMCRVGGVHPCPQCSFWALTDNYWQSHRNHALTIVCIHFLSLNASYSLLNVQSLWEHISNFR